MTPCDENLSPKTTWSFRCQQRKSMLPWFKLKICTSSLCLLTMLMLLMLTFMFHSVPRFPLTNEIVLEDKEGQANIKESAVNTQYNSKVWNNIHSTEFNTVTHVKPSPATGIIASDSRREKKKVLVLSSVGRSGSSFLGLILAALGNNMFFFEPNRQMPQKDINQENSIAEIIKYFHCDISDRLESIMRRVIINVIHPYTQNKIMSQVTGEGVIKHCMQEPLIIIKAIRVRLQWLQEAMHQKELDNLKVIHLVRDPRGSFTSMSKLQWNIKDTDDCDNIYQDLQARTTMETLYPSRFTSIKYEDLCRDPYGETRRLLRFLSGDGDQGPNLGKDNGPIINPAVDEKNGTRYDPALYQDLPKGVLDFLIDHTHQQQRSGPYTADRETANMFQHWREYITEKQLQQIEYVCGKVIRGLGHRMFHNIAAVRNSSLSLFDDKHS